MKAGRGPRNEEWNARIGAGVKAAWGRRRRAPWVPPTGTEEMFADLRTKIGDHKARRLVEEHVRIKGAQQ